VSSNSIDLVTLVVEDYDAAIEFFVAKVGLELVSDEPATADDGSPKRWVVVRPPGGGTGLLLAQASDADQRAVTGNQVGGRVGFFLRTDDFDRTHAAMADAGVVFREGPRREPYGTVAVWEDLEGNTWDLIGPAPAESAAPAPHHDDPRIGEVLITESQIAERVAELGRRITEDYQGRVPLLITVLKGSMVFMADLMRAIGGPMEVDMMAVSSYGAATRSSGVVRIIKDLDQDVADRDVLVVEDIVDSGLTLRYLLDRLRSQEPASLATCTLLLRTTGEGADDPNDQPLACGELEIDYVGFRLAPDFVIGYGLDAAQRYRNLPFIARYVPE
jgi:hypoxanthine phosphoribosyltransferase